MKWREAMFALSIALLLPSCAKKRPAVTHTKAPASPAAKTPAAKREPAAPSLASEFGIASWYGYPFNGRAAANGEIYDMEKLTAAHRTLPFGTWVRVTNLSNNKTVEVRITDRGPFIAGRVIDVSHAAAKEIELIGPGVAQVRLDVISTPAVNTIFAQVTKARPAIERNLYSVQAGMYSDRNRAEQMRDRLEQKYGAARLIYKDGRPAAWRLLVGVEESIEDANALAGKVQAEAGSGFVVRLDEIPASHPSQ